MVENERARRLKKEVRHQKRDAFLAAMPITIDLADQLLDELDGCLQDGCEHTLRYTLAWCNKVAVRPEFVVPWVQGLGGFCDCEVFSALEDALEDARKGTL